MLCDPKRNRKISAKNTNVAIKRVKSNASALALSSDSNIDEVNHAKVSKNILWFIRNVEFLEVAIITPLPNPQIIYEFGGYNPQIIYEFGDLNQKTYEKTT